MLIHKAAAVAMFTTTTLAAQSNPCAVGAGALFGVVGYQCANCTFKQELGGLPMVTFFAEPVVTETRPGSMVANGDVIIAVDGNPITTQGGADRFTYPAPGTHTLTVRRGRDRQDIRVDLQSNCNSTSTATTGRGSRGEGGQRGAGSGIGRAGGFGSSSASSASGVSGVASTSSSGGGGGSATSGVGRGISWTASSANASGFGSNVVSSIGLCDSVTGVVHLRGTAGGGTAASIGDTITGRREPIIYVDGVRQPTATDRHAGGRFGFALNAAPVCRFTQVDGKRRYTAVFEDYPAIYAIRPESAADKAGLRVGDVIVKVEGESVLDHPGLLTAADDRNSLHMIVRRDAKDINVVMSVTP